jgi:hypothetical protein
MIRPFAIVTISNTILAISAAVVLGISAYVEHTVSPPPQSGSKLMIDRYNRPTQLDLHLRCFRRSFHPSSHPRFRSLENRKTCFGNFEDRSRSFCPLMGLLAWYVLSFLPWTKS